MEPILFHEDKHDTTSLTNDFPLDNRRNKREKYIPVSRVYRSKWLIDH